MMDEFEKFGSALSSGIGVKVLGGRGMSGQSVLDVPQAGRLLVLE